MYALLIPLLAGSAAFAAMVGVLEVAWPLAIGIALFVATLILVFEMSVVAYVRPPGVKRWPAVAWAVWRVLFSVVVLGVIVELASLVIYEDTLTREAALQVQLDQNTAKAEAAASIIEGRKGQIDEVSRTIDKVSAQIVDQRKVVADAKAAATEAALCVDAEDNGTKRPGCNNTGRKTQGPRWRALLEARNQADDAVADANQDLSAFGALLRDAQALLTCLNDPGRDCGDLVAQQPGAKPESASTAGPTVAPTVTSAAPSAASPSSTPRSAPTGTPAPAADARAAAGGAAPQLGVLDKLEALNAYVFSHKSGAGMWWFVMVFALLLVDFSAMAYSLLGGGLVYEQRFREHIDAEKAISKRIAEDRARSNLAPERIQAAMRRAASDNLLKEISAHPERVDVRILGLRLADPASVDAFKSHATTEGDGVAAESGRKAGDDAQSAAVSGVPVLPATRAMPATPAGPVDPLDELYSDPKLRRLHQELIAQNLPDRYRLESILASGSHSCERVIFARDIPTGDDVVLKVLRLAGVPLEDRRQRAMRQREIQVLEALSGKDHIGELLNEHELYEESVEDGARHIVGYVVVLRRYRPGDLYRWANDHQSYPLRDVLTWTIQILETLADCTTRTTRPAGVIGNLAARLRLAPAEALVHCDISPPNLALEERDGELRIRILDFGIARYVRKATSLAATSLSMEFPRGRAFYASPEQQLQTSPDWLTRWTDVYSTFAVLYWLVSGRAPWQAEWEAQVESGRTRRDGRDIALFISEQWRLGRRPVPLHVMVPGVPAALSRVAENMLNPSYEGRQIASGAAAIGPDDTGSEAVRAVANQLRLILAELEATGADATAVGIAAAKNPVTAWRQPQHEPPAAVNAEVAGVPVGRQPGAASTHSEEVEVTSGSRRIQLRPQSSKSEQQITLPRMQLPGPMDNVDERPTRHMDVVPTPAAGVEGAPASAWYGSSDGRHDDGTGDTAEAVEATDGDLIAGVTVEYDHQGARLVQRPATPAEVVDLRVADPAEHPRGDSGDFA